MRERNVATRGGTLLAGLALLALAAPACGSQVQSSTGGTVPAPSDPTKIKVGVLHSLSGTMAISEVSVRDAELLAISEIN
ncbi:MAG TPA: transporter substrate-binding protein, partial [Candidatus Dormibacteraeota bacterium]